MGTPPVYSFLLNPQGAITAIEEYSRQHPQDEDLAIINHLKDLIADGSHFLPLPERHTMALERVMSAASLFSAAAPSEMQVRYVPRQEGDTLREFLEKNMDAFGLGANVTREERRRLVEDFLETTGIRFGSAKLWGSKRGEGEFVEPRDAEQVVAVFRWLDKHASLHGTRVDIWDYLASIYPPVEKMLENAQVGREIVVRVPRFMEETNFDTFSYATFAMAAKTSGLVGDIPEGTVGHHVRQEVERPRWETLDRYAERISAQADGDALHRRQIFDFLVFLRLLPVLKDTAPARDMADRPLTSPGPGYSTRYTVRVVPESELVEYLSFGETARFSVQRWPFSSIASGSYDRMLEIIEKRLAAFDVFAASLEFDPQNVLRLKERCETIMGLHAAHKGRIMNPAGDPATRTLEYLAEVKSFYRDLDRFFRQMLFTTRLRGSTKVGDLPINFEIVPHIGGIQISPIVEGRVSVFTDDIITRAKELSWPPENVQAVFALRLLASWHVAGGIMKPAELENAQKIAALAREFHVGIADDLLEWAAAELAEMNRAAAGGSRDIIEPALYRAAKLRSSEGASMRAYYVYDATQSWRERLGEFYAAGGHTDEIAYFDSEVIEGYFKAVRHPHYTFDPEKLKGAIASVYGSETEREEATKRITDFFRQINIRTEVAPRHPISPEDTSAEAKAIEWAFRDYLENFPGADEIGAKIELNERLLAEVVDRQIAEHPDVPLRKSIIRRGVVSAIGQFNAKREKTIAEIAVNFYPLPENGIFPERFYAFLSTWGREHGMLLELRPEKLLVAYNLIKDEKTLFETIEPALSRVGIDDSVMEENSRALFAWGYELDGERNLIDQMSRQEDVEKHLRSNFEAPLVSAASAALLINRYLTLRLTTPQPVDVEAMVVAEIGDRFDPYPTVKAEVVAFYHMLIRDYLHDLHAGMMRRREAMFRTIDAKAEQIKSDPWNMFKNVSESDFLGKVFAAVGMDLDAAPVREGVSTQYHPSLENIRDFDHRIRLLSEALGAPAPHGSVEEHLLERFQEASDTLAVKKQEARRRVRDNQNQLILAEVPVRKFRDRVFSSLDIYLGTYDADDMGRDDIARSLENIETGLRLVTNLEEELNGPILKAWTTAANLASELHDDDDVMDIFHEAETRIAQAKNNLNGQGMLLRVRLEELNEEEARIAADREAQTAVDDVNNALAQAHELSEQASNISGRIEPLLGEIKIFEEGITAGYAATISAHEQHWAQYLSYRSRADQLKEKLDRVRQALESIDAAKLQKELELSRDIPNISDDMKASLSKARKRLVKGLPEDRLAGEQAYDQIAKLGGALVALEKTLFDEEAAIPISPSVEVPDTPSTADSSFSFDERSVIFFNVSGFASIPKNKANRLLEEMTNVRVLGVGESSYLIDGVQAAAVTSWLSSGRKQAIEIKDIFGTPVKIAADSRGVRIAENSVSTDLARKIGLLFAEKGLEADLMLKLYEATQWNGEARSVWQAYLTDIMDERFASAADARLFTRRFALANKDEIESIRPFAKNQWFVKRQRPIEVRLSESEMQTLVTKTADNVAASVRSLNNPAGQQLIEQSLKEFHNALEPYLSTPLLEWWKANRASLPREMGMLWTIIKRGHNGELLVKLLLSAVSDMLEEQYDMEGSDEGIEMTDITKIGMQLLMEYTIELRFGDILYEGDRLVYDFAKHQMYAAAILRRLEHPELTTLRLTERSTGQPRFGLLVTREEAARIFGLQKSGGRETVPFTHFSLKENRFVTVTLDLGTITVYDSPSDPYARLTYEIFKEPRLLALGYMISSIMGRFNHNAVPYRQLLALFEKFNVNEGETAETKVPKLIELERDVEQVFRFHFAKPATAASSGSVEVSGLMDDETPASVSAGPVNVTALLPSGEALDPANELAYQEIKSKLAANIAGWNNLSQEQRQSLVNAIAKMARLRPGEEITMTPQGIASFYRAAGMTPPVLLQSFRIPNLFMATAFKIR